MEQPKEINSQNAKTLSIFHEPLVTNNHGSNIKIYVNSDKRQGWKIMAVTAVVTTLAVIGITKWQQKRQAE